jgi:DNA-binding CsgD family transcriptional regulator/tetratricopeptide (TPR) repeat protein
MRNAIAWSYATLAAPEQRLFRRLSIFDGGFALEAAEAVATWEAAGDRQRSHAVPHRHQARTQPSPHPEPPASSSRSALSLLDGLAALVDKSLLQVTAPGGEPRYLMLETIREFALDELAASGEAPVIARRHAAYYLAFAEAADAELRGRDQLAWLERLDGEHDNLRAALTWSLAEPGAGETALRLVTALGWFWHLRGHYGEGVRWAEAALALPEAKSPTPARARALQSTAVLALLLGQFEAVRALLDDAQETARACGDAGALALALHHLGLAELIGGHTNEAHRSFDESASLFRQTGNEWGLALTLCSLGLLKVATNQMAEARPPLQASLQLFRKLGDAWGMARALNHLGEIARAAGRLGRARALYEEALALYRQLGQSNLLVATVLIRLGNVAQATGDLPQAITHLAEAVRCVRHLGGSQMTAHCLASLGVALGLAGDPERGARTVGAALAVFEEINASFWPNDRPLFERNLAAIRRRLGEETYEAAVAEGSRVPLDQAIAAALGAAEVVLERESARTVVRGTFPGPASGAESTPAAAPTIMLTRRERQVLRLLVEGHSDREIAAQLSISHRTVGRHLTGIYTKLGVANRTAAATLAVRQGLV